MTNATIENILARQESTLGYLSWVKPTRDEKDALSDLWETMTNPVYTILAEYPTHDGDYEQRDSGVQCRLVDEYQLWLCVDEDDGFYLTSKDEGENWDLEEVQD